MIHLFEGASVESLFQLQFDRVGRLCASYELTNLENSGVDGTYRALFDNLASTSCTSFVLAHNHPSGIAFPSKADVLFTWFVDELAATDNPEFIDHFIVSNRSVFSMRKAGLL